ncbi:MAG: hypothetical protein P0119_17235 [Nitrospira sp.]|nr:hypothetical protein [Nitrospira sp.]
MSHLAIRLFLLWCCWSGPSFFAEIAVASLKEDAGAGQTWARLLAEAERLQLPTKFLKTLPSDFIHFDFDDLRTYAAEYHPGEHRMVLNRSLSFNAAGRMLRPLGKMTHRELEVLYHELFHAYMDYLEAAEAASGETGHRSATLLHFAREQQACRYAEVEIAPIALRKDETESRYLTQAESWEALNETWAVFIGWAVWNQLEARRKTGKSMVHEREQGDQWIRRFKTAFENGELRGYYVPEDPDERRIAQKRYLAKPSQLTLKEAMTLMKQVLGFQRDVIERIEVSVESSRTSAC